MTPKYDEKRVADMSLAAYAIETNKRREGRERGKDVSIFYARLAQK